MKTALLVLFIITQALFAAGQSLIDFGKQFNPGEWSGSAHIGVQYEDGTVNLECSGLAAGGEVIFRPALPIDIQNTESLTVFLLASEPLKIKLDLEDADGIRSGDVAVSRD